MKRRHAVSPNCQRLFFCPGISFVSGKTMEHWVVLLAYGNPGLSIRIFQNNHSSYYFYILK
ncbi:MAG: hypothetical protein WD077_00100 [Bacteroidia bacterium]